MRNLTLELKEALKRQVELLGENRQLMRDKKVREQLFKEGLDQQVDAFQTRILECQQAIEANVTQMTIMQTTGRMQRLLKIDRFRQEVVRRGGDPDALLRQFEAKELELRILEKDEQMETMEVTNSRIDQEVDKLAKQMAGFKQLLEGMTHEREDLKAQNQLLSRKLAEARQLRARLLP